MAGTSLGGAALASLAAAAKKRAAAAGQVQEAFWFYVEAPVPMYGLERYDVAVAQLVPGRWYLAKATYDEWVHASDEDQQVEGWVAAYSVRRQS